MSIFLYTSMMADTLHVLLIQSWYLVVQASQSRRGEARSARMECSW